MLTHLLTMSPITANFTLEDLPASESLVNVMKSKLQKWQRISITYLTRLAYLKYIEHVA